MLNKKIIVPIIIILLAAAGFLSYKYIFNKSESPEDFLERQLVFNVVSQNLPQQAIDAYKKKFDETAEALRKDFTSPTALSDWVMLGAIKKGIGDLEGAEQAWLQGNKISPQNSLSFGNLGDLYGFYLKEPQKSEEMYLIAIQNDPKEPNWYLALSGVYHYNYPEKKDLTDDVLLQGLAQIPDDVNLTANLATYYREIKDVPKAIEWYEKLLVISPNNETAKQDLAELKNQQ